MNTAMNNKYREMHAKVLNICENSGIRMIAGRRVSFEIHSGREINGIKDFLLIPADFEQFGQICVDALRTSGYTVTKGKIKNTNIYRIFDTNILATTVPALMNSPAAKHCPQFIVRELAVENEVCSYINNGSVVSFKNDALTDLKKAEYQGSTVYVKSDIREHLNYICGAADADKLPAAAYGIFSNECTAADFLDEARKRGLLSEERTARYNEYTNWKKENRTEIDKKYKEYQETLLGLKQP